MIARTPHLLLLLGLACAVIPGTPDALDAREEEPLLYVDIYAPILQFNSLTAKLRPVAFEGEAPDRLTGEKPGYATYINIKKRTRGFRFQYWLYFKDDIRLNREADRKICRKILTDADSLAGGALAGAVSELFHKHDWELVEVNVDVLGEKPVSVGYCAHSRRTVRPVRESELRAKHPIVKVISDSHATYPPGKWTPNPLDAAGWGATLEFAITFCMEKLAGHHSTEKPGPPPYVDFHLAGKCRLISPTMLRIDKLDDFPPKLPWDNNMEYEQ